MKKLVFILLLLSIITLLPNPANFKTDLQQALLPPSADHLLGTDNLGRDLFDLMIFGFKRSAQAVFISSFFALTTGLLCGLYAGYKGGLSLKTLELFSNLGLILPSFIVAIIVSSYLGFNPLSIGLALGVFDLSAYAIQVANLTMKVKNEDFVLMSRLSGLSDLTIIRLHILPHLFDPVSALFANKASSVILRYASLSFLGLGADITKPDWGQLLYEYRIYFIREPLLLLWPTLGIFGFCLFFHLLFDSKKALEGTVA